ncbi:MAG: phosphate acyltransferase [Candidatus Delongbacteria bacterium]|jgi:phosphate butyryltransferase|nr:phosphate acyltransferase [Candidatus Delongbacteria bacterium]
MEPIRTLDEMVEHVIASGIKKTIAVACGEDQNTIGALAEAVKNGFASAIMVGDKKKIIASSKEENIDPSIFEIIDIQNPIQAVDEALRLVKSDEADVLMKGLVGTDIFLKAVLDKEKGLLHPKSTMSYVAALEIPAYHKLLFITDTAVLLNPDLNQKIAMLNYALDMAKAFGIAKPKVALVGATEKVSSRLPNTIDYSAICKMCERGQLQDCIIDGPLDVFLACDKESVEIKGIPTPINGDADILMFPTLEACNSFYKGLMLFANAELGGLIQGTDKPVIVMSRSESEKSKFYCIAMSCLMA